MPNTQVDFIYFEDSIDSIYGADLSLKDKVQEIMYLISVMGEDAPSWFPFFMEGTKASKIITAYSTLIKMLRTVKIQNVAV
jgi:hypothetical protein